MGNATAVPAEIKLVHAPPPPESQFRSRFHSSHKRHICLARPATAAPLKARCARSQYPGSAIIPGGIHAKEQIIRADAADDRDGDFNPAAHLRETVTVRAPPRFAAPRIKSLTMPPQWDSVPRRARKKNVSAPKKTGPFTKPR